MPITVTIIVPLTDAQVAAIAKNEEAKITINLTVSPPIQTVFVNEPEPKEVK